MGIGPFHLAVCELAGAVDDEAEPLAGVLDLAAYDVRARLSGTLPRIVASYDDAAEAALRATRLETRRHGVLVVDEGEVVPLDRMTSMRRFDREGDLLFSNDRRPPARPFDELVAIVDASMNVDVVRTTREVAYRPTVRGTVREDEEHRRADTLAERFAVLTWQRGEPWVLRQSEARYVALGDRLRPTAYENFQLALAWLRERAPGAPYDDRFVRSALTARKMGSPRAGDAGRGPAGDLHVSLVLHALGAWLRRPPGGPYR